MQLMVVTLRALPVVRAPVIPTDAQDAAPPVRPHVRVRLWAELRVRDAAPHVPPPVRAPPQAVPDAPADAQDRAKERQRHRVEAVVRDAAVRVAEPRRAAEAA